MRSFKCFLLTAALATGGLIAPAIVDSAELGTQRAEAASGTKYYKYYADAKAYANRLERAGYYTKILKTSGGWYRVDYWSGH